MGHFDASLDRKFPLNLGNRPDPPSGSALWIQTPDPDMTYLVEVCALWVPLFHYKSLLFSSSIDCCFHQILQTFLPDSLLFLTQNLSICAVEGSSFRHRVFFTATSSFAHHFFYVQYYIIVSLIKLPQPCDAWTLNGLDNLSNGRNVKLQCIRSG